MLVKLHCFRVNVERTDGKFGGIITDISLIRCKLVAEEVMSHIDQPIRVEVHACFSNNVVAEICITMLDFMDTRNVVAISGIDDENVRLLAVFEIVPSCGVSCKHRASWV